MIPDLANDKNARRFSRRKFLGGSWLQPVERASTATEVADSTLSILVQARPERLAQAEEAIGAIGGLAIRSRDPRGRLVVAPDAAAANNIGSLLAVIADSPGVLSAALGGTELLQGSRS